MSVMGQVECAGCGKPYEEGARFCPYCGTAAAAAAPLPSDPFIGATVNGKFRVEAMIGQGGMGRVYRARHLTLDRPVVLKMLHRAYSSDPQIVQRFQREARAASRLNHPNSIAVLDFGETEDGTLFMAMEYLAGRDLGRVVADDFPLGEARIVRIGAQVLSALAEAHVQGVIHRDLKPENVMIVPRRDDPDARQGARLRDRQDRRRPATARPRLTQAGLVCGTPEYMSPEQARGADLDARSDLYSMGVLLYQLCTGALPFQSDTPVGFLTAHLSQIPVPPRQRRPNLAISPALDALVSRALEKDPARRFASADEMRAALVGCAPASGSRPGAATPRQASSAPAGAVTRRTSRRPLDRRGRPGDRPPGRRRGAGRDAAGRPPAPRPRGRHDHDHGRCRPTAPSTAAATPALDPGKSTTPPATAQPDPSRPRPRPRGAGPPRAPPRTPPHRLPTPRSPALASSLFKKAESRRAQQNVDAAIPLYLAALEADPLPGRGAQEAGALLPAQGRPATRGGRGPGSIWRRTRRMRSRVRVILATLE